MFFGQALLHAFPASVASSDVCAISPLWYYSRRHKDTAISDGSIVLFSVDGNDQVLAYMPCYTFWRSYSHYSRQLVHSLSFLCPAHFSNISTSTVWFGGTAAVALVARIARSAHQAAIQS